MLEENQVFNVDSEFNENEFTEAVEKIEKDIAAGDKKKLDELILDEQVRLFKDSLNFNRIDSSEMFEPNMEFGKILLKGRKKYSSDAEFGKWIKRNGLDKGKQQHRNRNMQLASFFENRDFSGINVTSGYIMARDKYADVAEDVYKDVIGKNFSCEKITEMLEKRLHQHNVATGKSVLLQKKPKVKKLIDTKVLANLENLEDSELADWYLQIDNQSQIFKGLILLEGRRRHPSHKEFNKWIQNQGLDIDSPSSRTSFMQLAKFFGNRPMGDIPLTAAYEIAAPKNQEVAEVVYEEVLNKNFSVDDIKTLIEQKKSVMSPVDVIKVLPKSKTSNISSEDVDLILSYVSEIVTLKSDILELLTLCVKKVKSSS